MGLVIGRQRRQPHICEVVLDEQPDAVPVRVIAMFRALIGRAHRCRIVDQAIERPGGRIRIIDHHPRTLVVLILQERRCRHVCSRSSNVIVVDAGQVIGPAILEFRIDQSCR